MAVRLCSINRCSLRIKVRNCSPIYNAITLTIMAWLITTGRFGQTFPFFYTSEAMIIAIANFMFLNAVAAISVTVLVKGLVSIHQKKKT